MGYSVATRTRAEASSEVALAASNLLGVVSSDSNKIQPRIRAVVSLDPIISKNQLAVVFLVGLHPRPPTQEEVCSETPKLRTWEVVDSLADSPSSKHQEVVYLATSNKISNNRCNSNKPHKWAKMLFSSITTISRELGPQK